VILWVVASAALGADPSGVEAYCRYVSEVASSESALDFSPELFVHAGSFGATAGVTGSSNPVLGDPTGLGPWRAIGGVQVSAGRIHKGFAERHRAQADCDRQRVVNRLLAVLEALDGPTPAAFAARLQILDPALAEARANIQSLQASVRDGRATLEELSVAQVRLDALDQVAADARVQLAALAVKAVPPREPIQPLIAQGAEAESRLELAEASLRQQPAWDLTVRGGYDQTFVNQGPAGFFALVSLNLNVGRVFQGFADAAAVEAKAEWLSYDLEGPYHRVEVLLQRLRETLRQERARLSAQEQLAAEMTARSKALEGAGHGSLRSFREGLWFDAVRVQSEVAFLKAHLVDLQAVLGG
jgi:hypothetical protein